ncbi:hypothetical protein BKA57DRAFT_142398 [Linnemannia elongata]|nr:hypothetical protein BKA57DRAFT_272274 [Linnemannia elongata]KAH7058055.1 hypothetical protein BKA57DRAFT_142398 [Linnemannia elongata]
MATPLPPTFVVPATQTETRRLPLEHDELPPLFPEKLTITNIWKYLDYKHVLGLGLTPLIALYGLLTTEIQTKTLIWSIVYYYATGLGITAGKFSFLLDALSLTRSLSAFLSLSTSFLWAKLVLFFRYYAEWVL